MPGVAHRLTGGHDRVKHAQGVLAEEGEDARQLLPVVYDGRQVGCEASGVDERAGLVAVVPFVAHVQRLGEQGADIQPAGRVQG